MYGLEVDLVVGCWVMEIAPDEESIAPAIGNSNKENLVQKEMGRRCEIVMD